MGTKTWMLVIADGDVRTALVNGQPDRARSEQLAALLFPKEKLTPLPEGRLGLTCPPRSELCVGCFPGVDVIAAKAFAIDHPSQLAPVFLRCAGGRTVYLHAMHSVVDWFAFAVWRDGRLVRSLSVSPENRVMEDIGTRMDFELPYWQGKHPVDGPESASSGDAGYPLPFHPLELGDTALQHLFGYRLEGHTDEDAVDADKIPLLRFKRKKPWFPWW